MSTTAKETAVECTIDGDAVDMVTQLVDNVLRPAATLINAQGGPGEATVFFTATVIATLHLCEQLLGNAVACRLAQHAQRITAEGWKHDSAGVH